MSTPVLFLVGAVSLAALMAMLVWLASRPRKERFGQSIDTFNRDLSALAPPRTRNGRHTGNRGPAHRPAARGPQNRPAPRPAGRPGPRPQVKR